MLKYNHSDNMPINSSIFKEYDVRGAYPKEINEAAARGIGAGFIHFLKLAPKSQTGKIVIARDRRPSSNKLAKAFSAAIIERGVDIIDIGIAATPELYFATTFLKADGGAMITASHLKEKYNGVKLVKKDAVPVSGYEIRQSATLKHKPAKIHGKYKKISIEKEYLAAMLNGWKINKQLPFSYSFDYDKDRLLISGKDKKKIRGDIVGGIIGDAIAKKGDIVVYDIRCSRAIPEYFRNKGVVTMPCRAGHFNIIKMMRAKKALFGIEITGHYYFKDFYYCEVPLYAIKKLAEKIKESKKNINELAKPFIKYHHSGIIDIPSDSRGEKIEKIIKILKKEYKNGARNSLDGLTVEFSNWWFNISPSRTESLIHLVIEAKNDILLKQKKKELLKLIS